MPEPEKNTAAAVKRKQEEIANSIEGEFCDSGISAVSTPIPASVEAKKRRASELKAKKLSEEVKKAEQAARVASEKLADLRSKAGLPDPILPPKPPSSGDQLMDSTKHPDQGSAAVQEVGAATAAAAAAKQTQAAGEVVVVAESAAVGAQGDLSGYTIPRVEAPRTEAQSVLEATGQASVSGGPEVGVKGEDLRKEVVGIHRVLDVLVQDLYRTRAAGGGQGAQQVDQAVGQVDTVPDEDEDIEAEAESGALEIDFASKQEDYIKRSWTRWSAADIEADKRKVEVATEKIRLRGTQEQLKSCELLSSVHNAMVSTVAAVNRLNVQTEGGTCNTRPQLESFMRSMNDIIAGKKIVPKLLHLN